MAHRDAEGRSLPQAAMIPLSGLPLNVDEPGHAPARAEANAGRGKRGTGPSKSAHSCERALVGARPAGWVGRGVSGTIASIGIVTGAWGVRENAVPWWESSSIVS